MDQIPPRKGAFVIYRPEVTSNRLEDFLYKQGNWAPSISYNHDLWNISNQFTPAEAYRHKMQTSGKLIRVLQRLEWRWQKDYELWWKSSVKVQAGYRGMKGREYFRSIREKLLLDLKQRSIKKEDQDQFRNGQTRSVLKLLDSLEVLTPNLFEMKLKILYSLEVYSECESACKQCIDLLPKFEYSYYILACCHAGKKELDKANEILVDLMATIDVPSAHSYQLHGLVLVQLKKPLLMDAIFNANAAYTAQPWDLELLLQRACTYAMAQHWEAAESDYNTILYYQPDLTNVICLRGRVRCCCREWNKAHDDYQQVLDWDPSNEMAWYGMEDITQVYDELPMIENFSF